MLMTTITLLTVFTIVGFLITYRVNYLPQQIKNNNSKQHLVLTWNSKRYHLHHWLTFTLIIFIMFISRYSNFKLFIILVGLLLGAILEGFLFKDWYVFVI